VCCEDGAVALFDRVAWSSTRHAQSHPHIAHPDAAQHHEPRSWSGMRPTSSRHPQVQVVGALSLYRQPIQGQSRTHRNNLTSRSPVVDRQRARRSNNATERRPVIEFFRLAGSEAASTGPPTSGRRLGARSRRSRADLPCTPGGVRRIALQGCRASSRPRADRRT
jgi:hypothetical protein